MKNLNQSLLAKAGWRMIQPGAGLWSSLLHNKYFKNGVLLDKLGKSKGTCSSTWRGITFGAANLTKGLLWRLGDGKSINFWTERWLPDLGSLEAHACIQLNEDKLKEKVCCYFDKGSWDIHKLRVVVPEALVQRIICVYANGNVNEHDKLIWGLSNGGNFTVKSAYDLQCGVADVTEWDWNFIWRFKLPPKITHFLWLLLHGRLLTNVHRCSRGLDDVATCPRCNTSDEDLNHLLRDCNYSINIWRSIWGCGRASTLLKGDLNTWLRCNLKDKSCSDNMIPNFLLFASTLWFLWKWRCSSIFDDKFSLPFWPNIVIKRYCKEWLQANESGKRDCSENSHLIVWLPPCEGWIKLNVDGGRSSYGGKIYAGGIWRDNNKRWLGGFSLNRGVGSVLEAEIWGIYEGLQAVWEAGHRHIVLESDSLSAIKLLHQDNIDNHPLLNLILSCKDFIRREWDCVITHGFRESNRVADGLAFLGKNMVAGIIYYKAPPPQIARLFLDDLCGIPTMRTVSL
ncbi:hypothetical protein ACOSQ2_004064 [Xanthoceras sorbifolium]